MMMPTLRSSCILILLGTLWISAGSAQARQDLDPTIRSGATIAVSDHVFMIPDEKKPMTLDLGGVHVRFLQAGPTHTRGDVVFLVEEDGVLFTGDVVMNEFPMPISPTSSIRHWLVTLDKLEALAPTLIVPSHYGTGSGEMIGAYRAYFSDVQSRVKALAAEGKTPEEASTILTEELAAKFSQWSDPGRVQRAVGVAFRERDQRPR